MNIRHSTRHRPYPIPESPWIMKQEWHELLFAHWSLPPEVLRPMIPPGLELETFDGDAWLGIVPFRMSGVRMRMAAALPWISAFPELNVRTYVTHNGNPGVFFFSLEAANPVAVQLARRLYNLPYFYADMTCQNTGGDSIQYRSFRTHRNAPPAQFIGRYRPTGEAREASDFENWLTARYRLYAVDARGGIYRGEIHHLPWSLQPAEAEIEQNTMALCHGITLPDVPPLLHYSRYLEVLIWGLQRIP